MKMKIERLHNSMRKERRLFNILILSITLNIIIWCFSMLIIRNLGNIIALFDEEQFASIFSQLETGSTIVPPIVIPLIILIFVMFILFKKNSKRLYIKIPVVVIFFILTQVISIMCTNVNGLYFGDIIISLINNLGGLGL